MRLLAVLVAGAEKPAPPDAEAIFRGEVRLNAMMFWLRYPDYLAWELLDAYEATRRRPILDTVRRILSDDEPILRRDEMPKWRFGAYERIDDELAVLTAHGLVRPTMKPGRLRSAANDFLLYPTAFRVANEHRDNVAYRWYRERMAIVTTVCRGDGGAALKERQYRHFEYFSTRPHEPIPPILPRVTERLRALAGS